MATLAEDIRTILGDVSVVYSIMPTAKMRADSKDATCIYGRAHAESFMKRNAARRNTGTLSRLYLPVAKFDKLNVSRAQLVLLPIRAAGSFLQRGQLI